MLETSGADWVGMDQSGGACAFPMGLGMGGGVCLDERGYSPNKTTDRNKTIDLEMSGNLLEAIRHWRIA
jgi:hypothetical protein